METKKENRAELEAKAQFEYIKSILEEFNKAETEGDEEKKENILDEIYNDPLSIQVRSGWHNVGEEDQPSEYEILLCTGGPACRIIGDLNRYKEPETATLQYQDWFTSWINYDCDENILLEYARFFYYGE